MTVPNRPIAAVTGSSGYVGGAVAAFLEGEGWAVRRLARRPGADVSFRLGEMVSPSALEGVSLLVHAAYDFSPVDELPCRRINAEGARQLFQAARQAGVSSLVAVSSMSAYDGCRSLYGRVKLEIERLAVAHGGWVVRPGLVYGNRPGGMYGSLARQVRGGRPVPLVGGAQRLHLIHQDDLGAVVARLAARAPRQGQPPVTAAHARPWTLRAILAATAEAFGARFVPVPIPWRPVWLALRAAEGLGLRAPFRSDSLLSLMHQDPSPDFTAEARLGLAFRPFNPARLVL